MSLTLVARSRSDYAELLSFHVHATVAPGHVHVPRRRCLYTRLHTPFYSTPTTIPPGILATCWTNVKPHTDTQHTAISLSSR